jgi:hypothetical protein
MFKVVFMDTNIGGDAKRIQKWHQTLLQAGKASGV